jgi:outer membrane usher protein
MGFLLRPRLLLLVLSIWACTAAGQTPQPPSPIQERVLPMEVVVNGAKSGTWLFVERGGMLYAPRDAFEEWRVQLNPEIQPIDFKGQPYWPLSAVAGFRAKMDFANQSVELLFSPQAFAATRLASEQSKRPVVSPVLPSLFFNYDVNYAATNLHTAPDVKELGMVSELGLSTGWGVLTNTTVGRNLTDSAMYGTPSGWVRLETTFTRDMLNQRSTLRLGDSSTRMGMWGRQVYFGGIQYGTNFALTPGFISQPLPVLSGLSTAPSTVELYVNDVLNKVSNVPTGPFVIDNLPVLTGSGEARLVIRDLLGRETVVVLPFFTSTQMLAAGLNDWSVEAGSLRSDLGIESNNYGPGFASGTWRHGYNNRLTLEGRAEATPEMVSLGIGAVTKLPWQLLGKAALVGSTEQSLGGGALWLLGLEHLGYHSGASIEAQGASADFRQLGQDVSVAPIKLQLAGNAYYATERMGSFGFGFAHINRFDDTHISTVSGNYSKRIGKRNNLIVTFSRAVDGGSGSSAGITFIMPLDNNKHISATANTADGKEDYYVTATKTAGQDSNLGWRVLTGQLQDQLHSEGGLYYLGRYGDVSGEISTSPDQTTTRLGANGGLVLADGNLFATRRVDQSFAVAEIAGYGDVGIGLGSNVLTRTDSSGVALIPRLAPYQSNSIRIDPRELPLSAEIDSIEQVAVPAWRSAVKVTFPVRSGRGALLKIKLDDGDVAPAGAIVQIEGDKEEFYVARRGEAFVTGLQSSNRVLLKWNNQQCQFDVTLPPQSPDEFPRLGPLPCHGVAR